jgi:hypothetical protein
MNRRIFYLILILIFAGSLFAQNKSGLEVLADRSMSGYKNTDDMGGPKSVGALAA